MVSKVQYYEMSVKPLTPENVEGLGVIFTDFKTANIELCPWPVTGKRSLISPGGYSSVHQEEFKVFWRGSTILSAGHQNARGGASGKIWVDPNTGKQFALVQWFSAHLDAGEAFVAPKGQPWIFLLAPPKDDVTPDDFIALYSDGDCGLSIHPGVWHTAPISLSEQEIVFKRKQGSIYATIDCLLVQEHNTWLKVPLQPV